MTFQLNAGAWKNRSRLALPNHSFTNISSLTSALALILCLGACSASKGQVPSSEPEDVVRVGTMLVSVPVFVTNGHHSRVLGLSSSDFSIKDENQPVKISIFGLGAERVAMVFALDASGSSRIVARQERLAARALLSKFGENSSAAVLRFADKSELVVPFTSDSARLGSAFVLPALQGHHTAIFDAASDAVRVLEKADSAARRIVILISDGLDTVSRIGSRDVIAEAVANGISFYVIHLPVFWPKDGRLVPRAASKGFKELAERTGGHYFLVGTAAMALDPRSSYDFSPAFAAIESDLHSQYVLEYYLPESRQDNRTHKIEVALTHQNNNLRVTALRHTYVANNSGGAAP